MAQEEFHCRGKFTMLHRNKPDQEDLKEAASFAKSFVSLYK